MSSLSDEGDESMEDDEANIEAIVISDEEATVTDDDDMELDSTTHLDESHVGIDLNTSTLEESDFEESTIDLNI